MNRRLFSLSAVLVLAAAFSGSLAGRLGEALSPPAPGEEASGPRLRQAAADLLGSLGPAQRQKALLAYGSEERFNWHFIPRDRKGVPLKDLDEKQRSKAAALLQAGLSATGARRAEEVMSLEDVLREIEGPAGRFPRDPLLYYVTFFNEPSASERWGLRFEGHHLALNWTLQGEKLLSNTPSVYGANPAEVLEGPKKGQRVLAGLEDVARELVASLTAEQLKACQGEAGGAVPEEVPGTEKAGYSGPFPAGVTAEKLSSEQRETLRKLIREYTQNLASDAALAAHRRMNLEELKDVHFAWRGGLKQFEPHSYMVHGPGFLINYSNVQNRAAHVHGCFRQLDGEFGAEKS